MSQHWPDPHGYWGDSAGQQHQRQSGYDQGGYQAPPGYQSGAWPTHGNAYHGSYGYTGYTGPPPPGTSSNQHSASTILALVTAIGTVLFCGYTNIIGVILAAVALGKNNDPAEAARMTRFAWISNWIHIGLLVVLVLVMVAYFVWVIAMVGSM